MAKPRQLSTSKESSKWFTFTLDNDNFEEYMQGFVPTTTAADTKKCIKLYDVLEETSNTMS